MKKGAHSGDDQPIGHHFIGPVERDCICPTRPPEAHTPQCEDALRRKFFAACTRTRERFYGEQAPGAGDPRGTPSGYGRL